jgi:AraC family transcriptional regulator of adaptative response / DNA-3-methyladenine glycosylase II
MAIDKFSQLTITQCQTARASRDTRFDGLFYVAVKTTGIFCRPICPAVTAKEKNVEYFHSQAQSLRAGYRPCLRCRPDCAPNSWAWKGTETTFDRAISLIEKGALQGNSIVDLSSRLGISDRYLRTLFTKYLGMPVKQYAQYQQLMFAKQLLHNSNMSITNIAFACGFNSVRRFNDAFQKYLQLTPTSIRKGKIQLNARNQITLAFTVPINWQYMLSFYRLRAIEGVEMVGDDYYQTSFVLEGAKGYFKAWIKNDNNLIIEFDLDDMSKLKSMVTKIRRMLDLDADTNSIEAHVQHVLPHLDINPGIRIPGVWDIWQAGIRAILGQQVSVKAAIHHLTIFTSQLGMKVDNHLYFPTPACVVESDISFLKMPQSRKDTIKRFASYMLNNMEESPNEWQQIKGIGPWTINYAKLRGLSEPDCFLDSDLIVKKIMVNFADTDITRISPWGSYATLQCWNSII